MSRAGRGVHLYTCSLGHTRTAQLVAITSNTAAPSPFCAPCSIAAVGAGWVELERALTHDVRLQWQPTLHKYSASVQRSGFEGFAIKFPHSECLILTHGGAATPPLLLQASSRQAARSWAATHAPPPVPCSQVHQAPTRQGLQRLERVRSFQLLDPRCEGGCTCAPAPAYLAACLHQTHTTRCLPPPPPLPPDHPGGLR